MHKNIYFRFTKVKIVSVNNFNQISSLFVRANVFKIKIV